MNKTAIKNFAIWARNKLIADIIYKAGLLGITEKGIKSPLPQSTQTVQFFDIGTKEPSSVTGVEIQQRNRLVEEIERKAKQNDYTTAYKNVIEEVAYTWFNRLIAIRFMEVNDYLPTRIRVLSSESKGKAEPDLVTNALEANLDYSAYEKDRIIQLKHENKLDDLFRMLFIKQCNALNANLPELFEKTSDYTELLLNVSFTDKEGVIYHLINDIDEDDFNVTKEGQVEIIGWLYQYYNTEPKDEVFALLKKNVKITKERVPAATQLFTPDWIVRYMVENSLGRLWLEGHPNDELKANWKYYLDEAEQEEEVQKQLEKIREGYKNIKPEDIKVMDPAMGSGHILVYAFDVLMQIYESYGFSQRDAAKSIIENNLYGLDIDNRAYQLAYFAVMMKARQFNRRILNDKTHCHIYDIQESNSIDRSQLRYFGADLSNSEKNTALNQIQDLLDKLIDAKEYGSILSIPNFNWALMRKFTKNIDINGQMSFASIGLCKTKDKLNVLIDIGETISRKYDVVITNPPYMGSTGMGSKLFDFIQNEYPITKTDLYAVFIDKSLKSVKKDGFVAMITQHTWMFLLSFENLRLSISSRNLINMAHLGARAFEEIAGEVVQTVAFIIRDSSLKGYKSNFKRLVEANTQQAKEQEFLLDLNTYINKTENFEVIQARPYVYWMSKNIVENFKSGIPLGKLAYPKQGLATADNNRFLRFWYEVDNSKIGINIKNEEEGQQLNKKWFPYCKGGPFRKWYGNRDYVINWSNLGSEIKSFSKSVIRNSDFYFNDGYSYSDVSTGKFALRYYGTGFIFDSSGPMLFINQKTTEGFLFAFMNSCVANELLTYLCPTIHYTQSSLAKLPVIEDNNKMDDINSLAQENLELSRTDWDSFETSWDFKRHPLILRNCSSVSSAYFNWMTNASERFKKIKHNEEELNSLFINIYNLQSELSPEVDNKDVTVRKADLSRDIRSFLSYAVGCMMGRYSLGKEGLAYAGGYWEDSIYRTYPPDVDNILPITDEEYFNDDIVGRFIEFIKVVYGNHTLEQNLGFISNALGGKGKSSREVIRNYFLKNFFKDHCQIYQKRPIYWLFDSGKQHGFKALIYMHRYDENTIGNLRIEYLHRLQRIYENEIARMQDTIENSRDAREVTAATKRKEKLIKQLQETKEYDEKIAHLALARTSIDLDDGVKVNYEKIQTDRDGKKLDVLAKI